MAAGTHKRRRRLQVQQANAQDSVAALNDLLQRGPDAIARTSASIAAASAELSAAPAGTATERSRKALAPPWLEVPSLSAISSGVQRQGELSMRATEAILRVSLSGLSSARASARDDRDDAAGATARAAAAGVQDPGDATSELAAIEGRLASNGAAAVPPCAAVDTDTYACEIGAEGGTGPLVEEQCGLRAGSTSQSSSKRHGVEG